MVRFFNVMEEWQMDIANALNDLVDYEGQNGSEDYEWQDFLDHCSEQIDLVEWSRFYDIVNHFWESRKNMLTAIENWKNGKYYFNAIPNIVSDIRVEYLSKKNKEDFIIIESLGDWYDLDDFYIEMPAGYFYAKVDFLQSDEDFAAECIDCLMQDLIDDGTVYFDDENNKYEDEDGNEVSLEAMAADYFNDYISELFN